MGFAAGLQAGERMAQGILDAYNQSKQQREYERIQSATPETGLGYTPQMGQQLESIANAKDAQGNPYYQLTPQEGGLGYGLSVRNAEGGYTPVEGPGIQPQQTTRFLGQTYEGTLTPERLQGLRYSAMADSLAKQDPFKAMQMRREATAMAREEEEAPLRTQALKQQVEKGGYDVSAAKRAEQYAQGNAAANEALAAIRAEGKPVDAATLASLAKEHGADYQALLSGELNQLGFTEKSIKAETLQLGKDLSRAALGGIPGMNKFLADKFDPNKADNITPEVVQTKNGFVVVYGDKVLNEYGTHKSLNELVSNVHGMISGDPLGTAKTLASIRASNASASLHEAEAGLVPAKGAMYRAQANYYDNVKGQAPTILYNDKNEPVPVVMGDLKRVDGVVQLPAGLRMPKDVQQATAQEARAFEMLSKSDAWQAAERKGDTAKMTELMVNRGLDPAKHGMRGGADWQIATGPNAARTTTAAPAPITQQSANRLEPQGREEFALAERARSQGLYPVGRGSAVFGPGELIFEDNTGRRVWASQVK